MLVLPATTVFNKRIPKQKFYDNLSVTPDLKRCFIDQIASIIWQNKVAPSTTNIASGEKVQELQVFEIELNQPEINKAVLQLIDREIPYHILFILTYRDKEQAWIGYKEAPQSGTKAFKVTAYYHTEWLDPGQMLLQLEGMTTDAVYENFVRQIASERLMPAQADGEKASLQQAVVQAQQREKLQKQIDALQKKVNAEKQFNKRVQLNEELKTLKKQMEML